MRVESTSKHAPKGAYNFFDSSIAQKMSVESLKRKRSPADDAIVEVPTSALPVHRISTKRPRTSFYVQESAKKRVDHAIVEKAQSTSESENENSDLDLVCHKTKQSKHTNNNVNTPNNTIHVPQQQSSTTSSELSSKIYFAIDDEEDSSQKIPFVNTPTSILSPNANFIDDFESPLPTPRTPTISSILSAVSPMSRQRYVANVIPLASLPKCDPQFWKNKEASLENQPTDTLLFNPNILKPEQVEEFEEFCVQTVQGRRNLNIDSVLQVLHSKNYNIKAAKQFVSENPSSVKRKEWTSKNVRLMMQCRYSSHSSYPSFDLHTIRKQLFPDKSYGEVVNKYYEEKNRVKKYKNFREYLNATLQHEIQDEEEEDDFEQSETGTENNETSTTEEEESDIHRKYTAPVLQEQGLDFDLFFGQEPQLSPDYVNYSAPQPKLEDGLDLDLFAPPSVYNIPRNYTEQTTPVSLQNPFEAISNNSISNIFNFSLSPNKFGSDSPLVLSSSQEPVFDAEHQIKE